jgi:hypothetical protein
MRSPRRKQEAWSRIRRDFVIVFIGISLGYWLIQSGTIHTFLGEFAGAPLLASFIAGFFFTSIFTTAPAIAALYEICQQTPLPQVAIVGAMGSMVGDFILFRFLHDRLAEDISFLSGKRKWTRLFHLFHTKLFEWSLPLLGALVIASPFPDELGLAILGFSKLKTWQFLMLSFVFNVLGIVLIGLATG